MFFAEVSEGLNRVNYWLCLRVPVHEGINILFSFFRNLRLAVIYCLVFCIGSCVTVHEDRT